MYQCDSDGIKESVYCDTVKSTCISVINSSEQTCCDLNKYCTYLGKEVCCENSFMCLGETSDGSKRTCCPTNRITNTSDPINATCCKDNENVIDGKCCPIENKCGLVCCDDPNYECVEGICCQKDRIYNADGKKHCCPIDICYTGELSTNLSDRSCCNDPNHKCDEGVCKINCTSITTTGSDGKKIKTNCKNTDVYCNLIDESCTMDQNEKCACKTTSCKWEPNYSNIPHKIFGKDDQKGNYLCNIQQNGQGGVKLNNSDDFVAYSHNLNGITDYTLNAESVINELSTNKCKLGDCMDRTEQPGIDDYKWDGNECTVNYDCDTILPVINSSNITSLRNKNNLCYTSENKLTGFMCRDEGKICNLNVDSGIYECITDYIWKRPGTILPTPHFNSWKNTNGSKSGNFWKKVVVPSGVA